MAGVLSGLRVIDLAATPAGAPVGQQLADHGADVLMVEPPGGSPLRAQAAFPFWARGKGSVVLDLHTPAGLDELRELLRTADVLVETFRPGHLERLGLSDEEIQALNPRLVHTSITGFPRTGPLRDHKGYEALVMAKIGGFSPFAPVSRRPGPTYVSVPYCTSSAAQVALQGTLAALYERETSGTGQHVETSLMQAIAAHDTWNWYVNVILDKYPGAFTPAPSFSPAGVPVSGFYFKLAVLLTKDGRWLQFSQAFPHLWLAFLRALGLDHLADDPEWKGIPDFEDETTRIAFWDLLIDAARQKTFDEWTAVFDADRNVWAEPHRNSGELLDHPQLQFGSRVTTLPDAERGPVRQPADMVRMSVNALPLERGAPTLDASRDRAPAARTDEGSPPPAAAAAGRLPLEGVTVLELATMFAAPYAATLLTDLGARVLKIEPVRGDLIRYLQPFPDMAAMKVMQGKESIGLDLQSEEGRAIVHELALQSDIVLQSYRPNVAQRLGVDAETLRALKPDLIYLNSPGYGLHGPAADRPVFAPGIGAAAGLGRRNGGPGIPEHAGLTTEEIKQASVQLFLAVSPTFAQADGFAALGASTALLLGLLARARGAGAEVMTTTMLSTIAHAVGDDLVEYDGRPPTPVADADLFGLSALYRLYQASDGWVFLAAPAPEDWDDLVTVLDDEALRSDPRFADDTLRAEHDGELATVLATVFAGRSAAAWEELLTAADVGCVEVQEGNPERVLMGDLGRSHGMVADVEHPVHGEHPRLAPLMRFSRSATVAAPTVTLGQHTDELLRGIGRTEEQIADLRARNVVG